MRGRGLSDATEWLLWNWHQTTILVFLAICLSAFEAIVTATLGLSRGKTVDAGNALGENTGEGRFLSGMT